MISLRLFKISAPPSFLKHDILLVAQVTVKKLQIDLSLSLVILNRSIDLETENTNSFTVASFVTVIAKMC